jgi:uncharacterized membrane protein
VESYIAEWLSLLTRWLHVITGVAWIGASLYFVMLDLSLKPPHNPADSKRGVSGELWAVHGGGFYQSQKFLIGPKGEPLSEELHWSKWEAYTTWLSGMGLMAIIYWYGANTYLIDRSVANLSAPAAIAISTGSLVAGWLVYDALCKAVTHELALSLIVFALLVAAASGYSQVFGARAAYVHVGALVGTIMVWNVFFHVIPGQKKMVDAIRAGREPELKYGIIGKQRSVHNTYFTLPVLFIMTSGHYPITYGNKHNWAVLAVLMLAGALIRQYFVLRHTGRNLVALPAAAVMLLLGLAIVIAPASAPPAPTAAPLTYSSVQPIIAQRCVVCHAEKPSFAGFSQPPGGLKLETPEQVKAAAQRIHQQTVVNRTMPIGNMTKMTEEERSLLGAWLAAGARTD